MFLVMSLISMIYNNTIKFLKLKSQNQVLLSRYLYAYKEFDSTFILLSMYTYRHTHRQLTKKDNKLNKVMINIKLLFVDSKTMMQSVKDVEKNICVCY